MENKFEHNGFEFHITERPDVFYAYSVHGRKDDALYMPKAFFDKECDFEQIKKDTINMMDGVFDGEIEIHNGINIVIPT